ncbi:HAMP domain-containing histidine kinase [Aminipila butyrica]|uniref:histidine kinase n=1 Tax=Aminipila butyrica TaxID=433296 RepID=A0A858BW85_9FIRM|nr:HAMP domain-containing sensor histidine kinase [Aminipila butyrica]QIB69672.1 HAMP domain-containing histidine kinase [Aminipila butyrica]
MYLPSPDAGTSSEVNKVIHRLKTQLALSILLILLMTIALIGLSSNWFISHEFVKYIQEQEHIRSENISVDLGRQYDPLKKSWNLDYVHIIGMYSLYDGYILKVSDEEGTVIWDAENHDMSLCGKVMDEVSTRMENRGEQGSFITHTYAIFQEEQKVGNVSVTYYGPYFLSEHDFSFLKTMNTVLVVASVLAGVASVFVGFLLARRIARPVTRTAYIAKQIAEGNYEIRFEQATKTQELNELVTAINHMAEALSKQENLRKRLTTDMAHELRTPLTAVGSHLEAMIEGLWEATPERLKSCHDEVKRLGTLVADLERLAKIEDENLLLDKTKMDLLEVVGIVMENMKAEAEKKKLSLRVSGVVSVVYADKARMHQVVTNLLSNAIKYTPEGGSVTVEVLDQSDCGVVKVTDTGIGIPEQELPLVFERFYRTDKSRNRKLGGAGIGLTIVKSIIAAHAGTVSAESDASGGSSFTIRIPKGDV